MKKREIWYLLDTRNPHQERASVNCMVCEESVLVNVEDILNLTNQVTAIAVHQRCLVTAVNTWGNGKVLE